MDYMELLNKLFSAFAEFIIAVAPEFAEKIGLYKREAE